MKQIILKHIRHRPKIRKFLSFFYLHYIKLRNISQKNEFKDIYYIDPKEVQYESGKYFHIFKESGKNMTGNWDMEGSFFDENKIYLGLQDRFIHQKEWKESKYFLDFSKEIQSGRTMWNCANDKELLIRCKQLDTIFNDIKENGYKRNSDSLTGGYDEVSINIARNGQLLFNDGAHRLSMAKILSIQKIPVRIIARHKNWFDFIQYLKSILPNQRSYQSLGHPDLDTNFTIDHPCYNRLELILPYIPSPTPGSKSLDIGGNIGFFTRELEKKGFNAYIIEHESFYLKILEKFKTNLGYSYEIIGEDMFTWKGIQDNTFDVVLALSIFHHFIKTEAFHKKLVTLLNNLNAKVIIFETHNQNEEQMEGAYKNYSPIEFVNFIMKETGLNSYEKIGVLKEDNREIFKIFSKEL